MAFALKYEKRDQNAAPNTLRNAGKIPAIFYGRKQVSTPITVSAKEFEKVWKKAGETAVINLQSGDDEVQALIKDVDRHPVFGNPRHADFYVFEKGQKLKIKIPLVFSGTSPAVKDLGAVLVKVMHDLEIEAAPKDLPQKLEVDISSLAAFGDNITAKAVKLPESVTLIASPDDIVASVYEPKEEVVEEAPVDLSAIEVQKKGKEEVPGEEGAAPADGAAPKKEEKKEEKR